MRFASLCSLLFCSFFSYGSIYDNLTPVPKVIGFSVTSGMGCNAFTHADSLCDIGSNDTRFNPNIDAEAFCVADGPKHVGWAITDHTGEVINVSASGSPVIRTTFSIRCTLQGQLPDGDPVSTAYTDGPYFYDSQETEVCPSNTKENNGLCYLLSDLAESDSCPDSSTDGDFVLPVTGTNTAQNICVTKPDGSSCGYKKVGDIYVADFEFDCNTGDGQEYDTTGLNEPIGDGCQDIGTTGTLKGCPTDPADVCSISSTGKPYNCADGCGFMDLGGGGSFVCLDEDSDNDGIGNKQDKDDDNDGIHDDEDLDSDGDGQEDKDFGDGTDLGAVENYLSDILNTNEAIKNGVAATNQGLGALNGHAAEISEKIDNIGQIELKEKGEFETEEEVQIQIDDLKEELDTLIETVQSEFDQIIVVPSVAPQWLGCMNIASINGSVKTGCVDSLADELEIISYACLFIFGLISIFILFR